MCEQVKLLTGRLNCPSAFSDGQNKPHLSHLSTAPLSSLPPLYLTLPAAFNQQLHQANQPTPPRLFFLCRLSARESKSPRPFFTVGPRVANQQSVLPAAKPVISNPLIISITGFCAAMAEGYATNIHIACQTFFSFSFLAVQMHRPRTVGLPKTGDHSR